MTPPPRVEDRPLGLGDQLHRLARSAPDRGLTSAGRSCARCCAGADVGAGRELDVLGDVDHDRAGAAGAWRCRTPRAARAPDRSTSFTSQLCLVQGRVMPTVSHSWKASLPIRWVGTWPVMQTSGNGVHQRVGEAGDRVGGAGAGGHQHDAELAGRARIAFGGVRRALLVAHQDVLDACPAGTARRRSAAPRRRDSRRCARRPGRSSAVITISAPVIVRAIAPLQNKKTAQAREGGVKRSLEPAAGGAINWRAN